MTDHKNKESEQNKIGPILVYLDEHGDHSFEKMGEQYHWFHRQLMLNMQHGLTKTYNLFHTQKLTTSNQQLIKANFQIPVVTTDKLIVPFKKLKKRTIHSIFLELGFDLNKPIREQLLNPFTDRKELDDIIFDELGLTNEVRKEVYWAVTELVKARSDKAASR